MPSSQAGWPPRYKGKRTASCQISLQGLSWPLGSWAIQTASSNVPACLSFLQFMLLQALISKSSFSRTSLRRSLPERVWNLSSLALLIVLALSQNLSHEVDDSVVPTPSSIQGLFDEISCSLKLCLPLRAVAGQSPAFLQWSSSTPGGQSR